MALFHGGSLVWCRMINRTLLECNSNLGMGLQSIPHPLPLSLGLSRIMLAPFWMSDPVSGPQERTYLVLLAYRVRVEKRTHPITQVLLPWS